MNRPAAHRSVVAIAFVLFVAMTTKTHAQLGTLAEPFPAPASNAALHYQRAILHLEKLDASRKSLLDEPVWESLPTAVETTVSRELAGLLYRGRFAIQAATKGTRTSNCNFGIEFADLGAATQLPHLEGMVQLGRLLTLRGAMAEAQGQWEEAAIIYFDGLRMGRHLTHQNTLLEAMAGIEVLRNNYVALSRWAVRCPSSKLVARSFGLLEAMQTSLVNPPQIVAKEGSILALGFDQLRAEYPQGNWAEMILQSYGQPTTGDAEKDRAAAKSACIKRGVPAKVFEDAEAFDIYVSKLSVTANRFVEAVTACATLPAAAWIKRGERLTQKYAKLITLLDADTMIDPGELGVLFAEHEAELTVARITLAVSASRREKAFPKSLDEISARFGGALPGHPYGESEIGYQAGGGDFSIEIEASGRLPRIAFGSHTPTSPSKN